MRRREFIVSTVSTLGFTALTPLFASPAVAHERSELQQGKLVVMWDRMTKLVSPEDYRCYYRDGNPRGLEALIACEQAFEKVLRESRETEVTSDVLVVWNVYNMGYVVKTRHALFSVDLKHRRASELVPLLDFALITHKHDDHYDSDFCKAMEKAGKPLVSSFAENTAFTKIKAMAESNGHPDEFNIKDVAIRAFRVDHAPAAWGIDFTTAYEMLIGDFRLLHTGDCGVSNDKLSVKWGRPDLWLLFPMYTLDVADAVRRIRPKKVAFGHLWELAHDVRGGRAIKWHIDRDLPRAKSQCEKTFVAFWGERII